MLLKEILMVTECSTRIAITKSKSMLWDLSTEELVSWNKDIFQLEKDDDVKELLECKVIGITVESNGILHIAVCKE